jgi:hypothetical protein
MAGNRPFLHSTAQTYTLENVSVMEAKHKDVLQRGKDIFKSDFTAFHT